jgi:hypothetical protein
MGGRSTQSTTAQIKKKKNKTGDWRKMHSDVLHKLRSSANIIRRTKLKRIIWTGYVVFMGEKRNAFNVFVGKSEEEERELSILRQR